MRLVAQPFFVRDALEVAEGLLGKHLRRGAVVLRITETEAYRYPDDTANHCRMGMTPRNRPMWGPPGHAYVYLCYGLHSMLNIVTNREGEGAAVLIRACEPVEGLSVVRRRRGALEGPALLTGPGKVGQALGLDPAWSGHALHRPGGLELLEGAPPSTVLVGPRIGIGYASAAHQRAPWRFAAGETPWVSHRAGLRPKPSRSP